MEKMHFELTDEQKDQLKPLFDETIKAWRKKEKGMIIFRLCEDRPSDAVFVPKKWALQINEIMSDFKKEE